MRIVISTVAREYIKSKVYFRLIVFNIMLNLVNVFCISVYLRIIMRKATFEWVTKQKTPSENNCSRGFFRIFVDLLLVERNHSLTLKGAKLISSNLVIVVLLA